MSGRVIFIGTRYFPPQETLDALAALQEELWFARISFLNAIARETHYQQRLAHERLRNLIKERLIVIPGGLLANPEKAGKKSTVSEGGIWKPWPQ